MMNKKIIISITGNIGAGKTTFINKLRERFVDNKRCIFVEEPTNEWEGLRGIDGRTFFEKIYDKNPERDAHFNFQLVAIDTRVKKLFDCINQNEHADIFVIERSPLDDYHVFATMLNKSGLITDDQMMLIKIRLELWNSICNNSRFKLFHIAGNPEVCLERIKKRIESGTRKSECTIGIGYLRDIEKHYCDMQEIPLLYKSSIRLVTGELDSKDYAGALACVGDFIEHAQNFLDHTCIKND
jgi:deoxyadenosine/deoxycytidine kinase